jgi:hypothetical protein
MTGGDRPGCGWAAILRRVPARRVAGRPEGGYTDAFEVVCRDCGDDPYLDYRDVPPKLQRIRGPYRGVVAGAAAYEEHIALHPEGAPVQFSRSGRP